MVIYNLISTIFLIILSGYSYFLFNSYTIFFTLIIFTVISLVANNLNSILQRVWYTITTFTNIFTLILLVYFVFNIPIVLKFKNKIPFQIKVEEKSNIIKLNDKLSEIDLIFQEVNFRKLKEFRIDSKEILPLLNKNRVIVSDLLKFMSSKKIIAYKDIEWKFIEKFIYIELYQINYNLRDQEYKDAREEFEKLIISLNNFSYDTFNRQGVIKFYNLIEVVYDFYMKNNKKLKMNNEMLVFSESFLDRAEILQVDSLKVEINRIRSDIDHYNYLTTYINNKEKSKIYENINLIWPFFDKNKSKIAVENYYLGLLVLLNNKFFVTSKAVENFKFKKDNLYLLTNVYGNYLLPSFTKDLEEDFYIRERVMSKVEAVKAIFLKNIEDSTDRLNGEKYRVKSYDDRIEVESKYKRNKKAAFSFTYYQ